MLFATMFRLAAHRMLDLIELLLVRDPSRAGEQPAPPDDRR